MRLKAILASCLIVALALVFLPAMAQDDDPAPTLVDPLSNIQGENLIPQQATPEATEAMEAMEADDAGDTDDTEMEIEVTDEATPDVTDEPTEEPTPEVTDEPTEEPTPEVTDEPTDEPTPDVTDEPTEEPAATPTPTAEEPVSSAPPARPDIIFDFGLTPVPFTDSLSFGGIVLSSSGAPGLLIIDGDIIFVFGLPIQLPISSTSAPQSGDVIFDFD
jgi:hypothetical protein